MTFDTTTRADAAEKIQKAITDRMPQLNANSGVDGKFVRARQKAQTFLTKQIEKDDLLQLPGGYNEDITRQLRNFVADIDSGKQITVEDALCQPNLYKIINQRPLAPLSLRYLRYPEDHYERSDIAPYKDSQFMFDISLPRFNVRTANCLKNDNVESLGQLLLQTEAELLRTPNFGRKGLGEIKEYLSGLGLQLGMSLEAINAFEKHPSDEFLSAYPDVVSKSTSPQEDNESPPRKSLERVTHETYDNPSEINRHLVLSGGTYVFSSSKDAQRFAAAAGNVFKEAGGLKDSSYSAAVSRLGSKETMRGKEYLVHLSDAALDALSQAQELKNLNKAIAEKSSLQVS